MEQEQTSAGGCGGSSVDMEEIRQRRLAYFQNVPPSKGKTTVNSDESSYRKPGINKTAFDKEANHLKNDKQKNHTRTTEFHMKVGRNKETSTGEINSLSEEYVRYTSSKVSHGKNVTDITESTRARRDSSSSISENEIDQLLKLSHSRSEMGMTPLVSKNTPQFSNVRSNDSNKAKWVSNEDVRESVDEEARRVIRRSGDKDVEILFSNRKSMSAQEIPGLALKDSVDIDSVSVFNSKADFEDLQLSTHRPESTVGGSIIDFADRRKLSRQRSMSSESLLLGSKAEEMKTLLGERKYREFVEKSERELNHLHRMSDAPGTSTVWNGASKPERLSRIDGSPPRSTTPTPPLQPPSPQPAGMSRRGPSPRRRLRSSSPQMVSKTLQDIARTKENKEAGLSRNYEQVVVPHNVTFSADEIYRQAYGTESSIGSDMRKSSSSLGSSYQDPGYFWNNATPRQMAGGMSPTSPHTAPMFPPQFIPMSTGTPVHPSQQMHVGSPLSPGAYFHPQNGIPLNMAGSNGGQFMYPRQQNMFMPMSPGTSPQSPEPYLYHLHPMSQSMAGFNVSSPPMHSPRGMPWQYGQQGIGIPQGHGQSVQAHGQQGHPWNQYGQGWQQNGSHYSQNRQENPGLMPHPPARSSLSKGAGDTDRSRTKSSSEHADAVRHYHEQRRQEHENPANTNSNQTAGNFSNSSLERYFTSLGMTPPNYPPPPYHLHMPPPSHPPVQHAKPDVDRSATDLQRSSDSKVLHSSVNASSDYDDMTTVTRTSAVTGTSIGAGGITERLEKIGVDPLIIQSIKQRSETAAADEEALEAMKTMVRICPECQAVNKEYMTWCLQCGGVLIGVDPIPAKDLKKKNKEKKGNVDPSSKTKKTPSQINMDETVSIEVQHCKSSEHSAKGKVVPLEVQHIKSEKHPTLDERASSKAQHNSIQEPRLEFEETIKEEIIYDHFDEEHGQETEIEEILQDKSSLKDAIVEEATSEEEAVGTKESPESGRGASASSSPCRRNMSWELSEDVADISQNNLEVTENKDSGRPSSGEGVESRKAQLSAEVVPEDGPRRSEKEISEICEVINDPIIRGFIKNYLQKKPQDPTPVFSQPPLNKHGNSVTKRTTGKRSSGNAAQNQAGVSGSKSLNIDLGASVNSTVSGAVHSAPSKKTDTPKKKGQKKSCKKGHEAIDVEIFAIEEAKIQRSARSGANIVPMLNLAHSSDEEDDSSGSLQGGPSVSYGASSDTSSPRDDHAPVNYSNEIKAVTAELNIQEENNKLVHVPENQEPEHLLPNREAADSNFQFLKEVIESQQPPSPARGKKTSQARAQPQLRPSPTSKVRASIEAPPPNRRWMRSSIAWSSYHPRELRTRSSVNLQQGPGSGPGRQNTGISRVSRSTDNLVNPAPPEVAPSQRPRPSSADQNRRGANRGRPSSAGHGRRPLSAGYFPASQTRQLAEATRSAGAGDRPAQEQAQSVSDSVDSMSESPRGPETDIEGRPIHRLAVQEDTLPLIPAGPNTALKIYDRCFEMSPRDAYEQVSKWLFLPDELWLHVFTYLAQIDLFHITLTCKQLYRIAHDPQLWKRVTVKKKSMKDEWLTEIAKRHPISLAMIQCHGDKISENALRELFREIAPKLKELNFSRCSKGKLIGDEILLHASTHCRHLTHVDASWCHVTDVGLMALGESCHRLESLCLNGCQKITDESLRTVLEKHGTSLRVLELFGCFSLSPASFRNLAEHCTFLLTLNMGQCYKISDSNMVTLAASLSRVETLDLRGCKKLGDNSIRKIVRSCRRLRHLTLANCPLLSNASIVEIATYSTDIRSLDVCGCCNISDSSIQTLANNCYRLTSIDISSTSCTHRSVLMLADNSRNLESAKFNFLTDIHERSLAKLIKNCKRLNTIHLYGCNNVRDVATLKRYNRFLNIEL